MVLQFPRIPRIVLVALSLAVLGLIVGTLSRMPARTGGPHLEVRVIGWTNAAGGGTGMELEITNTSRWWVMRHSEYDLNFEGLGSRTESLLPARGLGPATSERVIVPLVADVDRWSATFRFTGRKPRFADRFDSWRPFLSGLGFPRRTRNLPPSFYVQGTVETPWFTRPPAAGLLP